MSDVTDAIVVVGGSRPSRGRPRADEAKSSVSAWIPTEHHDELVKLATHNGISVSQFVGRLVAGYIRQRSPR
jgi:hypothetical protein